MALFNRSASVILTTTAGTIEIRDVRIIFDCNKSADPTKNTARIQIYNLSESTRTKFDIKDARVTLNAGYLDSGGEEIIFVGDITQSIHRRVPPDIVTIVDLSDGFKAMRDAKISESMKAGTTIEQVVKTLTAATGLPIKELTDIPNEQYSQGLSLIGPVYDALVSVAEKAGLDWSIQNNEIQVVAKNGKTQDRVVKLSPSSGLVNSPERILKDANKPDYTDVKKMKVTSLLIPKFAPARVMQIESNETNGLFRIDNVNHKGDTHGNDWTSVCEVRAI